MPPVAVVLLNMGGPDSLDAVQPFLFNLLRDRELTEDRGSSDAATRTIAGDEELLAVLAVTFGLHLPPGTRLLRAAPPPAKSG